MKIICIGSSSKGNAYVLQGQYESLMIECGLPMSHIRKWMDFMDCQGCLISHRHGDHNKSMADVMKAGIRVYAPQDVWDNYKGVTWLRGELPLCKPFSVGGFQVIAFPANHDVPCCSYLINHEEMGTLLFITDSAGCNYDFGKIDHIMIECNYSEELLQKSIDEGRVPWFVAQRTRETHFGLEGVKQFLTEYEGLDNVKEVILLHLSHDNSEPAQFQAAIEEATDKPVYVAGEGLNLILKKYERWS